MANSSFNVAFPLPDNSVNVTNIEATTCSVDPENNHLILVKNNHIVAAFSHWLYFLKQ